MTPISVVIITKNEAANIVDCIQSAKMISDDIIVVDSGSSDETAFIAKNEGAKVFPVQWKSYGDSRNIGAEMANNNWIMALDADERITPELAQSVNKIDLTKIEVLYRIKRQNYIGDKKIQYGAFGFDKAVRIYHRQHALWDQSPVHEKLVSKSLVIINLNGCLIHLGKKSINDYRTKMDFYAKLCAYKYLQNGKKAGFVNRYFSPLFNFTKSYLFQFGFLDGSIGFELSKIIGLYTWRKYYYLHQLMHTKNNYLGKKKEILDSIDVTIK